MVGSCSQGCSRCIDIFLFIDILKFHCSLVLCSGSFLMLVQVNQKFPSLAMYQIESNIVRCPDPEYAEKMIAAIDAVRVKGDSIGGVVTCIARNVLPVRISTLLMWKTIMV